MEFFHKSVLLNESLDALSIRPGGVYLDATAGGGGHSAGILERLNGSGGLIAVDRDPDAVEALKKRFSGVPNITIVKENFCNVKSVLRSLNINSCDGVIADLGVSSHQLDDPLRGFSFHTDAPLDMRMSKEGLSAFDVVNTFSEEELKDIIYKYGEEKYAPSIAKAIVRERKKRPIGTTLELSDIISNAVPMGARRSSHPARRTFQAIRIYVNGELENLPSSLSDMFSVLNPGGVLAVITFHSLEDRIVKNKFSEYLKGCVCPPEFPVCVCGKSPRGKLPFKFITPSPKEIEQNPRSRSAKLRAIVKI